VPGGCRVGAGWVPGECRGGAGWVPGGCRVGWPSCSALGNLSTSVATLFFIEHCAPPLDCEGRIPHPPPALRPHAPRPPAAAGYDPYLAPFTRARCHRSPRRSATTVDCTGRQPQFWPVKRPARPHKTRHTKAIGCGERGGRVNAPGGPGQSPSKWKTSPPEFSRCLA
jgi:hypothetical protein